MKQRKAVRILLTASAILAALLLLIAGGFVVWANGAYQPSPVAQDAMKGNDSVMVTEKEGVIFFEPRPISGPDRLDAGFVFYPGGKVEAEAYAPLLSAIAAKGHPVAMCRMPLNLAVFGTGAAKSVFQDYPDTRWVLGGHSLGGSMAAYYAYEHPSESAGLILLGSYPAEGNDFSQKDMPILSIFGSNDMGIEDILKYKPLLPPSTIWLELKGGNHAQFGDYGPQKGDGGASLSREAQQAKTVEAITAFLDGLAVN